MEEENKFFSTSTSKYLIISGLIIGIAAILLFIWQESILELSQPINKTYFGLFGDFFSGVIGSLWALAGVVLFYVALRDQRSDFQINKLAFDKQVEALNLQLEEFRNQRIELEHTRKISASQYKTIKKQQFETTFFSLLDLRLKLVSELPLSEDGDSFFCYSRKCLLATFISSGNNKEDQKTTNDQFSSYYYERKHIVSHYFKSLSQLLNFVDNADLTDEERKFYAKILRVQFTEDELFFLNYYARLPSGSVLQPHVLRYNLFEGLPSISKLEFSQFIRGSINRHLSNMHQYYDAIEYFLGNFLSFLEEKRLDLLSGEVLEKSIRYNNTNIYIGLSTNNPNNMSFKILFENYNFANILFGMASHNFINYTSYILYDLLSYSRFGNDSLNIQTTEFDDSIIFELTSEIPFAISKD